MILEGKNVNFTETFSFEHLINEPTSFKGSPGSIDLIITSRKSYLKNACVTVTGIPDFSLKSQILNAPPKIETYRNQKTFHENRFSEDVKSKLDSIGKLEYLLFH